MYVILNTHVKITRKNLEELLEKNSKKRFLVIDSRYNEQMTAWKSSH